MPRPRQDGFPLLTASALAGLAGLGATLGTLPELARMPDPWGAAPLAALGLVAWLRHRRERRVAARLRGLRIGLRLPVAPAATAPREGDLHFHSAATACWRARRDGWQVELRHHAGLWRLGLTQLDSPDPALPLATAAAADAALQLARRLLPGLGQAVLRDLLDRDLGFPLPGAANGMLIALAEGGYALRTGAGERAIAPEQVETLLGRGEVVALRG